jgi:hypothetical protein
MRGLIRAAWRGSSTILEIRQPEGRDCRAALGSPPKRRMRAAVVVNNRDWRTVGFLLARIADDEK